MKRIVLVLSLLLTCAAASAQSVYWVFLADKAGVTFDPYTYFDAKAIERYNACGADLYDISNYPLVQRYVDGVNALATEEVGTSRWMNAMGVVATPEQVQAIEHLPYVLRVQPIEGDMQLTSHPEGSDEDGLYDIAQVEGPLEAQLVRMGGKAFRDKGIDGKGVRIAVFDGGFPRVNTHVVFKHLRDNHQILKTWNFPNRKENVYGWNSHGTMTLSCIAGRVEGKDLGLATGAEFLLARTEVEAEPFKEEVWWMQAVEWADKNGANIISSSLGYGKERHYTTDMDGTSYVAKAGNLAARKGILVCNSAGNEGDDRQWKTIITPSDADSVLCVGGIENSLTEYNHISFSSYGPSADGRLKPNVCAFGYARTANVPNDQATHYVHGTSFSCPLVAGFAACAWQASPGKTAMEMFRLIEQSGDLYPYYDYAFGYGVPQADFFTAHKADIKGQADPTFRFVEDSAEVRVVPSSALSHANIFYHYRQPDGRLDYYGQRQVTYMGDTAALVFSKRSLAGGRTLAVHLNGYTATYTLAKADNERMTVAGRYCCEAPYVSGDAAVTKIALGKRGDAAYRTSQWGSNAPWRYDVYFQLGFPVRLAAAEQPMLAWSPATRIGGRLLHAFSKSYCLGLGLEWGGARYNYQGMQYTPFEQALGADLQAGAMDKVDYRCVTLTELGLELFQRVRLVPVGLTGKGFHWDLGIYGNLAFDQYSLYGKTKSGGVADHQLFRAHGVNALDGYRLNYGVTTRLVYDFIGVYARYRLNGIGSEVPAGKVLMPRLEAGVQFCF